MKTLEISQMTYQSPYKTNETIATNVIKVNVDGESVAHYNRVTWFLRIVPIDKLEKILFDIHKIEIGEMSKSFVGQDADAVEFDMNSATFWTEFPAENEEENGGTITLRQFKLAVQIYLQFLEDPDHKPIKIPFPE